MLLGGQVACSWFHVHGQCLEGDKFHITLRLTEGGLQWQLPPGATIGQCCIGLVYVGRRAVGASTYSEAAWLG